MESARRTFSVVLATLSCVSLALAIVLYSSPLRADTTGFCDNCNTYAEAIRGLRCTSLYGGNCFNGFPCVACICSMNMAHQIQCL
jgi:hypothetical protein